MNRFSFTRNFLLIFAGPILWALHFILIYGWTGVICARPPLDVQWLGLELIAWGILVFSAGAILAILAACLASHPKNARSEDPGFIRWLTLGLAGFAILSIVWETLPVFIVPLC